MNELVAIDDETTTDVEAIVEHSAQRAGPDRASTVIARLQQSVADANRRAEQFEAELDAVRARHAEEVRLLRFELQEAEETITERSQVSEQLAIDLVENRGQKLNLERMLSDREQDSRERIETLEKRIVRLERTVSDCERKLETKSNAIRALMEELSRGNRADSEHHVDDSTILEAVELLPLQPAPAGGRITRLLVGRFHDQDLRFPLFKARLTIGRTRDNDIYLNVDYVSRKHAVLVIDGGKTRIIDWGSKNGVYVNSKRIKEHFLNRGDTVTIGPVEFRYEELTRRDAS